MDAEADEMRQLLEQSKIRGCIERLARGEDRRTEALIRSACWPDSRTDYGVFQGSFDAYLAWVLPGSDAIANTQHILGQSLILLDGVQARVETHVLSYHRVDMGSGAQDIGIGGRYLDRMEKRGREWRIAHRTMLYDWYQHWGPSTDLSGGVMGLPFSAGHFAGRAVGDHSATFFADDGPTRTGTGGAPS